MSNVLIGIIGVILFIGLALAGALFLGQRFQESSTTSKASASVAQVRQIVSAIELYQLETGRTMIASDDNASLLLNGYLKSMPANPFNRNSYDINDATANLGTAPVRLVISRIGSDSVAKDGCMAIEKQFGRSTDLTRQSDFQAAVAAGGQVGCLYYQNGLFYVYART